jgi:SagB-type dehydrogenase family enzyme
VKSKSLPGFGTVDYHERTKHRFNQYAAGPATLDWDEQPESFRWFSGTNQILLPLAGDRLNAPYARLFQPGFIPARQVTKSSLAALFELALGLSAWKEYGDSRWALRCNPSSGNLHPTEGYALVPRIDDVEAGVYHYLSRDHLLEQRCLLDHNMVIDSLPQQSFLVGLSSIHWREAWKYGERAYRYCQLDVGHAIAAVRYAAATLGWKATVLPHPGDNVISDLLGLNQSHTFVNAEPEHPDVLLVVSARSVNSASIGLEKLQQAARTSNWSGVANRLTPKHRETWPVVEDAARACTKPQTSVAVPEPYNWPEPVATPCSEDAATIIRQRRSAQAFDGVTRLPAKTFYRMLDMTLPRANVPPWDALLPGNHLHLVLFVHRVDGLDPGLYAFSRRPGGEALLKKHMPRPEFSWEKVDTCPQHLPLYCLVRANGQKLAATLSCHQGIAAQSCFSLGMLAEFQSSLIEAPWNYRHLFWEAGVLGQVLYLEAEAAGVRGTGIGCYFDDEVHKLLGIESAALQSMYHFTVGAPLVDTRLVTLPPYTLAGR